MMSMLSQAIQLWQIRAWVYIACDQNGKDQLSEQGGYAERSYNFITIIKLIILMSIPLPLQNLSSIKKSPTSRPKSAKQPFANQSNNLFFHEISHKLYDLKNLKPKKKIVILDEFPIPQTQDGHKEDIEGAITSRYEPVQSLSRDLGLIRCKKMVIDQNKRESNKKIHKQSSPPRKTSMKRRLSFQQSTKKR